MPNDSMERARLTVERARELRRADVERRVGGSATHAAVMRTMALQGRTGFRRFLFENGLVLAVFSLFLLAFGGQVVTGQRLYNARQRDRVQPAVGLVGYLRTGTFVEATAENWESEFLQMAVFVVLSVYLYQRGSAESKTIEQPDPVDQPPDEARDDPDAPGPVRRGGSSLMLYKHSLSLSLFGLFLLAFLLHAAGGAKAYNEQREQHGAGPVSMLAYVATSQFWFESFQNWQSEFLSVGVLMLLSIWLREQGSSQSKPVASPHSATGE